jgi:xylulokinase
MYLLGFDVGSSSIKASLIEAETGKCIGTSFQPKKEMKMIARQSGWAEQDPQMWWENLKLALTDVLKESKVNAGDIKSIGISYQMHGLVIVDKNMKVLRPSIIWCDSRAVEAGNKAFNELGHKKCLENLLNSPGNFTASKLKWVKDNEPDIYNKIYKIMLPGDYIAARLTGEIKMTVSGLSEGIFWDFKNNKPADFLFDYFGFDQDIIPDTVTTFSEQGNITKEAARELGLSEKITVSYRAGDQPNNAFSLNVLNPGEIAATAGTSGVVYGISNEIKYEPQSRVNTFAHVNHEAGNTRLGVLLCINGTGILNSWLKHNVMEGKDYDEMNRLAAEIPVGSDNLYILPFGNGAERVLLNKDIGCSFANINFNIHTKAHLLRAAQEGIVFSLKYGLEIMENIGIKPIIIRAGHSNMFLSEIFRDTLSGLTGAAIELYDTDGSIGAARGAGIGSKLYKSYEEAFSNLKKIKEVEPDLKNHQLYSDAYNNWLTELKRRV